MGATQSSRKGKVDDALNVLEEEVKAWNDNLRNLKEDWLKGDRSWICSYLTHQMEETETRWLNAKSMIQLSSKELDDPEIHTSDKEIRTGCQTTLSKEDRKKSLLQRLLYRSEENTPRRASEDIKRTNTRVQVKLDNQSKEDDSVEVLKQTDKLQAHSDKNLEAYVIKLQKQKTSEHELQSQERKYKEQNETLDEYVNQPKKHIEMLKVKNETLKADINELQEQNDISKEQNEKLEERVNQLQNQIEMLKAQKDKLEAKEYKTESDISWQNEKLKVFASNFLKRKEDMFNAQKKNLEDHISKLQCKVDISEVEVDKLKSQEDRLQKQYASLKVDANQLRKQNELLQEQIQQVQSYKNQLQAEQNSRLSRNKYAVDSNHATSNRDDLSLPIQVATWYAEIYRNEWQDAYEQLLQSELPEEEAIEVLKLVLQDVFQFCKNDIRPYIKKTTLDLRSIFEQYRKSETFSKILQAKISPKEEETAESYGMVSGRKKRAQDIHSKQKDTREEIGVALAIFAQQASGRKKRAQDMHKQEDTQEEIGAALAIFAQQDFRRATLGIEDIPELKPFILKCLQLGWMMAMQNPPVVFQEHHSDVDIVFDKDLYREYKTSGPLIKFVVWPALLLHENGPLLARGFAEGKKRPDLYKHK